VLVWLSTSTTMLWPASSCWAMELTFSASATALPNSSAASSAASARASRIPMTSPCAGPGSSPLLQRDQNGDQSATAAQWAQRLADDGAGREKRIAGLHRHTGRRRRRQQIAHLDRRDISIHLAEDLAHQGNRQARSL